MIFFLSQMKNCPTLGSSKRRNRAQLRAKAIRPGGAAATRSAAGLKRNSYGESQQAEVTMKKLYNMAYMVRRLWKSMVYYLEMYVM